MCNIYGVHLSAQHWFWGEGFKKVPVEMHLPKKHIIGFTFKIKL